MENELIQKMSKRQKQIAKLYMQARGRVVIWSNEKFIKIIDPDEIFVINDDNKAEVVHWSDLKRFFNK